MTGFLQNLLKFSRIVLVCHIHHSTQFGHIINSTYLFQPHVAFLQLSRSYKFYISNVRFYLENPRYTICNLWVGSPKFVHWHQRKLKVRIKIKQVSPIYVFISTILATVKIIGFPKAHDQPMTNSVKEVMQGIFTILVDPFNRNFSGLPTELECINIESLLPKISTSIGQRVLFVASVVYFSVYY